MMNSEIESLAFMVPLALDAHSLARQFQRHQSDPHKAKQVYLNTLAVYAVNFYLQCQEFETDWEHCASQNPVIQSLADVADLEVKNCGKLECRPVLPDEEIVRIPPEVWEERVGYVAVKLDESLREATLLGFVDRAQTETIPLQQLRSLEELPEYLDSRQSSPPKTVVSLSQWLQNVFDASWQAVETLFEPPQELAWSFRSPSLVQSPEQSAAGILRGKLLQWERADTLVALLVGVTPTVSSAMKISVAIYPAGGRTHLPQDLRLAILDEEGDAVMQAQARSTDSMQLEFRGEPGEQFSVQVALGDRSLTEAFVV
jgi:hypothetical protein